MDAATCVSTEPVFIQFDDEDGKIYGYKDLKVSLFEFYLLRLISEEAYIK